MATPGKKKVPPVYEPKVKVNLTSEDIERLIKEGENARQELVERTRGMNLPTGAEWNHRVK
jgi:hypothetical protein